MTKALAQSSWNVHAASQYVLENDKGGCAGLRWAAAVTGYANADSSFSKI